MFPKLAANLFISRAAISQTAQFRTVVGQFSPSYPSPLPPTPIQPNSLLAREGNPSQSSHSGSAGGSKSNPGSQFYEGYTGPGRAVTQANAITSNDHQEIDFSVEDAELEVSPKHKDTIFLVRPQLRKNSATSAPDLQIRRSSISYGNLGPGHKERAKKFGILAAVKSHIQSSKHVFSTPPPRASPLQDADTSPVSVDAPRLASTLATRTETIDPPPLSPTQPRSRSSSSPFSLSPRASSPSSALPSNSQEENFHRRLQAVALAKDNTPRDVVKQTVLEFLNCTDSSVFTSRNYDWAIMAMTPASVEEVRIALDLYRQQLAKDVAPNASTYNSLIGNVAAFEKERHSVLKNEYNDALRFAHINESSPVEVEEALMKNYNDATSYHDLKMLFNAAIEGNGFLLKESVCNALLSLATLHKDVQFGIAVFGHLEDPRAKRVDQVSYVRLMELFNTVKDTTGVSEIFSDYLRNMEVQGYHGPLAHHQMMIAYFRSGNPDKALGLLEQMMDSKDASLRPTKDTYNIILTGFCQMGDLPSAVTWFQRLVSVSALQPVVDFHHKEMLVRAMFEKNAVDEYLSLMPHSQCALTMNAESCHHSVMLDYHVRMVEKMLGSGLMDSRLQVLLKNLMEDLPRLMNDQVKDSVLRRAMKVFVSSGRVDMLLETLAGFSASLSGELLVTIHRAVRSVMTHDVCKTLTWEQAVKFSGILKTLPAASEVLAVYGKARQGGKQVAELGMDLGRWNWLAAILKTSVSENGTESSDVLQVMKDLMTTYVLSAEHEKKLLEPVAETVISAILGESRTRTTEEVIAVWTSLPNAESVNVYVKAFAEVDASASNGATDVGSYDSMSVSEDMSAVTSEGMDHTESFPFQQQYAPAPRINYLVSSKLEKMLAQGATGAEVFATFEDGAAVSEYPNPNVLADMIYLMGKESDFNRAKALYSAAQSLLLALENNKPWQAQGWFAIENAMVVACSNCGDLASANLHRSRIIDQGSAPSAAAYAALIVASKSFTDDATVASQLFAESQQLGVRPNTYLFNAVISKLSKARRAEEALDMFRLMKTYRLRPTSVTYGALIGACARVGDEASAKYLFGEMTKMPNFRPRVPPYNTMMQLFTHVKPDRDQALYYYNAMLASGVEPTAHTYKLLLDLYGTIEPVDHRAMQDVFNNLVTNPRVHVQGTHWASLINAYGCVAKDLNAAIDVFESIAPHPSSAASPVPMPDAIAYEALINAFVTLHRMDLVPVYLERFKASHMHMTAYVANVVIKGYAAAGDLEKARAMFETLMDPPSGFAAVNNHAPHDDNNPLFVPAEAPVYREPSTWEAMVRAELGAGERDRAQALIQRMEAR
ncbi:hypothetical protein FRC03_009530 [Tulasnella sp. 419]|nr:hypothetical protein FRC03_009530 [Tulasnella sp. 419]